MSHHLTATRAGSSAESKRMSILEVPGAFYEVNVELGKKVGRDVIELPGGHVGFVTHPPSSPASWCRRWHGQGMDRGREAFHDTLPATE
jgi:hypothetical protein